MTGQSPHRQLHAHLVALHAQATAGARLLDGAACGAGVPWAVEGMPVGYLADVARWTTATTDTFHGQVVR